MCDVLGKDTFKLGFGLMRLPKLADGSIDIPQVKEMADLFLAAGGTYFDTAFVYDGGKSEEAFKAAVVDRYPRSAYTIATKLHAGASGAIWGLMTANLVYNLKYHINPIYALRGIVINLVYSFSAGVSWQGHIGGDI